jgi:predicted Ser/Thr protein kinase
MIIILFLLTLTCINALPKTEILRANNITLFSFVGEGSFANVYSADYNGVGVAVKLPKRRSRSSTLEIAKELYFMKVYTMFIEVETGTL